MASDPSADSQTRGLLAEEFADLREQSIAINAMTVNGKDLFDAREPQVRSIALISLMASHKRTFYILALILRVENIGISPKDVIYNSG